MINKTIGLLFALAGIILMMSCSGKSDTATTNEAGLKKPFLKNVKTVKAEFTNQNEELTLTGKVEYNPDKVINYVSLVSGIADQTYFSLGDKVQKGKVLLDVRSSDLNSLQSEYSSAQSELKVAQRELQTAQSMYDDKMLSEKELLEAQARLKQAQSSIRQIESDMSVHGKNKGDGTFSIKAPMTGYIVAKNVSSGSTVSADSEPLFTIADLSTVWITANVYAGNLAFVKEGMDVNITTLSYPGEVFSGKINMLSQVFDPEEKVLKARIVMANQDLKFKPEMSAVITLKNTTHRRFISVPSDALIFDDNKYYVVVEASPDQFESKEVILQGHNNKTTYIASGLNEGDLVVIKNQLLIYSGLKAN